MIDLNPLVVDKYLKTQGFANLGSSTTNCEPTQSQSVAFKGCSCQLFDGDLYHFGARRMFLSIVCWINVYISMDI